MLEFLCEPLIERLRPMEAENTSAARLRIQKIREARFYARTLVLEGKGAARRSQIVRDALTIFCGLQLYSCERFSLFLGLNDSDRCSVNEQ